MRTMRGLVPSFISLEFKRAKFLKSCLAFLIGYFTFSVSADAGLALLYKTHLKSDKVEIFGSMTMITDSQNLLIKTTSSKMISGGKPIENYKAESFILQRGDSDEVVSWGTFGGMGMTKDGKPSLTCFVAKYDSSDKETSKLTGEHHHRATTETEVIGGLKSKKYEVRLSDKEVKNSMKGEQWLYIGKVGEPFAKLGRSYSKKHRNLAINNGFSKEILSGKGLVMTRSKLRGASAQIENEMEMVKFKYYPSMASKTFDTPRCDNRIEASMSDLAGGSGSGKLAQKMLGSLATDEAGKAVQSAGKDTAENAAKGFLKGIFK